MRRLPLLFILLCLMSHAGAQTPLLEKIAAVTAVDHRQTVQQYARSNHLTLAQAEYEFKATGIINCEGMTASAEIVGKSNVLITAAHVFRNGDTCHYRAAGKCFFALIDSPSAKRYPLDVASLKMGLCARKFWPGDWATVKTKEEIPDVKPYRIPNSDVHLNQNQILVAVAAQSTNFKIGNTFPKTVEICRARDVYPFPSIPLSTDCNNSGWASGSGLFFKDPSGRTTLAAINVGDRIGKQEKTGYDINLLNNIGVLLEGDFLRAVHANLQ